MRTRCLTPSRPTAPPLSCPGDSHDRDEDSVDAGRRWNSGPGFGITEHPDTLTAPLRWRKPRRVFVNSMSDLFHAGVSDAFIARVFAVMAATPQHTYQLLTKRHGRMRSLLNSHRFWLDVVIASDVSVPTANGHCLPNVWLGVSVEDQQRADLRVPALLDTPAAVRFLSCEPLLGPVDLQRAEPDAFVDGGIDWIIVGGESGKGARPLDVKWVRSLIKQGHRHPAGRVFVKQMGACWARDNFWGGKSVASVDSHGGDFDYWPSDLRVREFPAAVLPSGGRAS